MGNIKSSGCNDWHQKRSRILENSSMKVSYQSSRSAPASVSILTSPFIDNDKSKPTLDKMIDDSENMEDDNDENKDNTSFPVTGSEPMLPTLKNVKVIKRKTINNPTLTQLRITGSSATNGDR